MNNTPIFDRLVREIAEIAGAENWYTLAERGVLHVDGVKMRIEPDRSARRERLLLHTDFSELPSEETGEFMRHLLQLNFVASMSNQRFFSTDIKTGRLVASWRIPLSDETDGAQIVEFLQEEAKAARAWQDAWSVPDGAEQTAPEHFFDKV